MPVLARLSAFTLAVAISAPLGVHADTASAPPAADMPAAAPVADTTASTDNAQSVADEDNAQTVAALNHPLSETIYAVSINGERVSDGAVLLQAQDGTLYASDDDVSTWRLQPAADAPVMHDGKKYHKFRSYATKIVIHVGDQSVDITVPPSLFRRTDVTRSAATALKAGASGSASLDYTLAFHQGGGIFSYDDNIGLRTYAFGGEFATQVQAYGGEHQQFYIYPLNTAWWRDFPSSRTTLAVGDSVSVGGAIGDSLPFLGLRYGTNFAMVPALSIRPAPALNGVAQNPGTVNIYANGGLVSAAAIPQGPFTLSPTTFGQDGEVSYDVIVKDPSGRTYAVSQAFYSDQQLLARGLHQYSYALGSEAMDTGTNAYGPLFAEGHESVGLTNELTGEFTAEYGPLHKLLGTSAVLGVPHVGSFTAGVGYLAQSSAGPNRLLTDLAYGFKNARYSFAMYARQLPNPYGIIGINGNVLSTLGASFTVDINRVNQFIADFNSSRLPQQLNNATLFTRNMTFGFQHRIQGFAVTAYAAVSGGQYSTTSFGLTLERAVGKTGSAYAAVNAQDGQASPEAGFAQTYGRNNQLTVQGAVGGYPGQKGSLDATAIGNALDVMLNASFGSSAYDYTDLTVHGGVAIVGSHAYATRDTQTPYALVDVGAPNVPVSRNNMVMGKTAADGTLFVPNLAPYMENTLSIDPSSLPFGTTVDTDKTIVPLPGVGSVVRFAHTSTGAVEFRLVNRDGVPVKAGTQITIDGVKQEIFVGTKGLVYVDGIKPGKTAVHIATEGAACNAPLSVPQHIENVPNLGTVQCE